METLPMRESEEMHGEVVVISERQNRQLVAIISSVLTAVATVITIITVFE